MTIRAQWSDLDEVLGPSRAFSAAMAHVEKIFAAHGAALESGPILPQAAAILRRETEERGRWEDDGGQ